MADWWLRSSQGGFIGADELQSCAVAATALQACSVQSQKASLNLRSRSVVAATPAATTCAGLGSTGFVVWRPAVPVSIDAAYLVPVTPWCSSSTAQVTMQLWSCATGVLGNYTVSSTVFAAGALIPLTLTTTAASLTGTESLMAWANASSCQFAPPGLNIVVNYQTTA